MQSRPQLGVFLLAAVLASASMWFYFDRILVSYQIADSAVHDRPRGNLSDLYPRWLGARELLLHGRNPYADDVALEIQKGYYGRVLDPARPGDPKDQQGFAYPVYVVFLLSPLIRFSFHNVQLFFHWLLIGLTAASVWWWLRALRWRVQPWTVAACMVLMLGCFPGVQGIKLQQLSLLVAALLAASAACVASGGLFVGGVLLAVATIKPQLAWPFVAWILLWAMGDWRARRNVVFGFGITVSLLLAGAEIILPGWWRMFAHAIEQYHRYTQNQSVLDQMVPWGFSGKILAAGAVLATSFVLWKWRASSAQSIEFARAVGLVMALTVLVVPMYAPYNQVLLLPALLVLARERMFVASGERSIRFAYLATAFALCWQWIASLGLTLTFLSGARDLALKGWWLPALATFALPVLVFALALLDSWKHAAVGVSE